MRSSGVKSFPDRHVGKRRTLATRGAEPEEGFREETGEVVVAGSGSCRWYLHR